MIKQVRNTTLAALFALPLFLFAQNDASELSEKDQRKFDYFFFEGSRYKQIERNEKALASFLQCFKIDETNAAIAFEIGKLYLKLGSGSQGLEYLELAYELDPTNKWIALELGNLYSSVGAFEESTLVFAELVKQNPEVISYRYELAQLLYAQKRYKECLVILNEIQDLVGIDEDLSNQKKELYLLLDDEDGARKEIEDLVAAFPANVEYRGLLAQFYSANLMFDEAIAIYDEMLKMAPDDPRAHLDLANIYKQQKKFDKSFEHLKIALASPTLDIDRKIQVLVSFFQLSERDSTMRNMGYELIDVCLKANPSEPKLYAMLGDYQIRDNRLEDARNSFKKAVRLGANQIQIWSELLLLDAQLGMNDSLVLDSEGFIELYPNQPLGYLMAGSGNLGLEKFENAISFFETGLDFVIDQPQLEEQFYISLADAHHRLEQHSKSDAYFDKALEINPNSPTVLNNYAYYLSVRGVRLPDALEMTEKCNQLAPNNAIFLDTWSWVLYKSGKYNDALVKMELCAKNGGANNGEVLEHWGDILFKLNRTEEAIAKWREASKMPDASEQIQSKIDTQQLYE